MRLLETLRHRHADSDWARYSPADWQRGGDPLQEFSPPRVLAPSTPLRMGRTGAQNLTHATHRPIPPTFTRGSSYDRPEGICRQKPAGSRLCFG